MTSRTFNSMEIRDSLEPRWYNAILPIAAVIFSTLIGLFISGGGVETFNQGGLGSLFSVTTYSDSFSNANSGKVLLIASLIGCIFSVVLLLPQRILSPREIVVAWGKGVSSVFLASMILILAWALNSVSGELGTASFLIAVFKDMVSALWVPILIFLLSGAIAFATGSSWSTMAILIPMAVPLAYEMGGMPLMIIAMGAVLDGSIFGDHCSPLSDTTILSSIACSCDHIDHVKTQMPYALLAMVVATFVCYLPAAMGVIPYALIGAGGIVMVGFLLLVGRDPEAEQTPPPVQPKHFKENPNQRIFAPNESD